MFQAKIPFSSDTFRLKKTFKIYSSSIDSLLYFCKFRPFNYLTVGWADNEAREQAIISLTSSLERVPSPIFVNTFFMSSMLTNPVRSLSKTLNDSIISSSTSTSWSFSYIIWTNSSKSMKPSPFISATEIISLISSELKSHLSLLQISFSSASPNRYLFFVSKTLNASSNSSSV